MQYLEKTWVRILASLVIAAVSGELLAVALKTRPPGPFLMLMTALVCFALLSAWVKRNRIQ